MKYLILLLVAISFSVMLSFATAQNAECYPDCGGFCSSVFDCAVGCNCKGASGGNQGTCSWKR